MIDPVNPVIEVREIWFILQPMIGQKYFFIYQHNPTATFFKVECTGKFNSDGPDTVAVTHSGPEDKNMVQIVFEQAEGAEQVPEFEVIIVKEYSKYWTDMHI